MARKIRGGQFAVATAAQSLVTALTLTGNTHFAKITVKNADDAANIAWVGTSNVASTPANAIIELGAGDSYTFGADGRGYYNAADIYVIASATAAANVIFVALEE